MDSFPTDPKLFDQDERISYSKLDKKYLAVRDDGEEFEFDEAKKKWVIAEAGDDDEASPAPTEDSSTRKRKGGPDGGFEDVLQTSHQAPVASSSAAPSTRPPKKAKAPPPPRQNTAIYVTGIPSDATLEEIHELFSRKGGVIAEEIDSGRPRIKMYMDENGQFKGDALIVFFKPQSVEMAIVLLDDTDFRFTKDGKPEGRIKVQEADSSYKKVKYEEGDAAGQNKNGNSGSNRAPKSAADRQKVIKKTQKMQSKLADWDDDYPAERPTIKAKHEKTVILTHMFTLKELEDDPSALLEIKEDVREECEKLGTVTNVVLFDLEDEGIVSVKFREPEAAQECIKIMHGRNFGGQVVEAFLATGKEKFRQSKNEVGDYSDSD